MTPLAAATIVAKSRLAHARVLAQSFLQYHPAIPFFVLLADEVDGCFDLAAEQFPLLQLPELGIPHLARFRFHHSQQELTYAATPYLLSHLLDRGFTGVAFLKQESLVVGDLSPVFEVLGSRSIVLAPHLLAPLHGEQAVARELNILQSGIYNVGFLGVSDTPTGRAFLSWWQDRVYADCRHDVPNGLHFEQRWLDLVPAFFEDVHVVRDPGFNVGHWNLPERKVELRGDAIEVDGRPCRFVRFSGFDPDRPHAITRYSPRLNRSNVGPAAELFTRYAALVRAAGHDRTKNWPYAWDRFDNGVRVTEAARRTFRELGEAAARFGDPLAAGAPDSFFCWFVEHDRRNRGIRRAARRLWEIGRGPGGVREAARVVLAAARRRLLVR